MDKIERTIKEYSSKKLKEIIEEQSASYNEQFIDYAKDELIRRGEGFKMNSEHQKDASEMNDVELKKLVEEKYDDYHLEYIEIARKEYLKRGFKNETAYENLPLEEKTFKKRYSSLRTVCGIINAIAWITAVAAVILAIIVYFFLAEFSGGMGLLYALIVLFSGAFYFIILFSASEGLKVLIDIEENTRRSSDYYQDSDEDQPTTTSNEENS